MARIALLSLLALSPLSCGGSSGSGGGEDDAVRAAIQRWNEIACDTSGIDHAPSDVGPPHQQGEQLGPCRSSRALAMTQVAVFEVVNSVRRTHESYLGFQPSATDVSLRAAVVQASHDTLIALFPSQSARLDDLLQEELDEIPDGPLEVDGISLGQRAAEAILALRADDGSQQPEPLMGIDYIPSDAPGIWRQDPISQVPIALGATWPGVRPFVLESGGQFPVPPPPALDSVEYAAAYDEANALGGDGVVTPTERSDEQTFIGLYWAYDGTPSLCAPPRLYNQIASQIAREQDVDAAELARLLALVNVAMADTGIAVWDSKYLYEFWRPIAGIRESDPGTGPTGLGDGNDATIGDVTFNPLGAPASNESGPNFTPPFPAYPSGHAGFGGALFQTLRRFFGTDDIAFTFVSDEFNGITVDNEGQVRPLRPRTFPSLSAAEEENGQSRIYLGIHWEFDKTYGILQGRQVADFVFDSLFPPLN